MNKEVLFFLVTMCYQWQIYLAWAWTVISAIQNIKTRKIQDASIPKDKPV